MVDPELEPLAIDGHEHAASDLVSQKLLGIIPVGPESTEGRAIAELTGRELESPSKSHTQIGKAHGSLRSPASPSMPVTGSQVPAGPRPGSRGRSQRRAPRSRDPRAGRSW